MGTKSSHSSTTYKRACWQRYCLFLEQNKPFRHNPPYCSTAFVVMMIFFWPTILLNAFNDYKTVQFREMFQLHNNSQTSDLCNLCFLCCILYEFLTGSVSWLFNNNTRYQSLGATIHKTSIHHGWIWKCRCHYIWRSEWSISYHGC